MIPTSATAAPTAAMTDALWIGVRSDVGDGAQPAAEDERGDCAGRGGDEGKEELVPQRSSAGGEGAGEDERSCHGSPEQSADRAGSSQDHDQLSRDRGPQA